MSKQPIQLTNLIYRSGGEGQELDLVPEILWSSRTIYNEAVNVLYGRNVFILDAQLAATSCQPNCDRLDTATLLSQQFTDACRDLSPLWQSRLLLVRKLTVRFTPRVFVDWFGQSDDLREGGVCVCTKHQIFVSPVAILRCMTQVSTFCIDVLTPMVSHTHRYDYPLGWWYVANHSTLDDARPQWTQHINRDIDHEVAMLIPHVRKNARLVILSGFSDDAFSKARKATQDYGRHQECLTIVTSIPV